MECLLKPVDQQLTVSSCIKNEHISISYCFYVRPDPNILPDNICAVLPKGPVLYRGSDVAKHLVNALVTLGRQVMDIMKINIEMCQLTAVEQEKFDKTSRCESCSVSFGDKCAKVRDHNHWTGKFRAVLCNRCNLQRRYPTFLPVVFYELSNYDSHFIIQELAYDTEDITIIPQSEEKYISFSKTIGDRFQLRFLDSYSFQQASLAKLAKTLTRDDFIETEKVFKQNTDLATRKSVFPYEYIDCVEKLDETKLPDISAFYSKLSNSTISEADYGHAKTMWDTFECKTIGDYSDNYLLVDVMVLVDVFEKFRVECLKNYKLDPAHYYSCPGLSFDAMLRYTGVKLELLTDHDMLLMFQLAIRGGLTLVVQRHARANHPEVDGYDPSKAQTFLQYIDATNLYGFAMMQPMPCGEFECTDVPLDVILSTEDDSDYGYLLEVDVDYPQRLHDLHNDLPFLPVNECPPLKTSKYSKLLTTLSTKNKYIVHYRALKQAVEHGLVVTNTYRVIRFKQSRWLAPYIELNTELRKKVTTVFGQTLPKTMNNSCYGKTLENMRNHQIIHLVSCP
ncbi:uncharacterized protein LOC126845412 [Adelges cooleyi]|uniref:uncharacterized protein LOC126845412 n=1 Tax=Adelges cooleyi TaxID=133065 RepID=UPI00217FA766|nr:uncharacterized protein LOC126845412 [Adelges cooleyi]